MLKDKIVVAEGFQASVNIAFDLHNEDKIRSFIPTRSSLEIIEDVLYSTSPKATSRSRVLIGAYGRGKSHIILVLMALLFKKDVALFEALLNKLEERNPTFYEFALDYIKSDKKLLPIVVSGSSSSLTQSFLSALQQVLKAEDLSDLMPETHFIAAVNAIELWKKEYADTYNKFVAELNEPVENLVVSLKEFDVNAYDTFKALYPKLTSGSEFNPLLGFDVVELYEHVVKQLKTKGYDGVYIIYDEFSKYLESSLANATVSDTKLLQDFAEKCDRSGNDQMHLMLISHKDIANYIDKNLPKEKVDGWRGVSGRFKHITLHNNFSQMYEIISQVIKKEPLFWNEYCTANEARFGELEERFTTNAVLEPETARIAVQECYPLHPLSTFILPRISEKVAQNERTLFTFLSMPEKNTLSSFIQNAAGEFPMLTPDYIYDYFESLLRKEHRNSESYKLYRLTTKVLSELDSISLEAKIIKTIALIYVVEQFEKMPPTYDAILSAFDITYPISDIQEALSNLINKESIVYLKRSNGYLKIKESSGVDVRTEIQKQIEKTKAALSVEDILNSASFDSYMYPTAYNDRNQITRYFDFIFIDSSEFFAIDDWAYKTEQSAAEGVIYAVVPKNETEIDQIRSDLELVGKHCYYRSVFVFPKEYVEIEQIAFEYQAVKQLKELAIDDALLADEYDVVLEDLDEVVSRFISSFTRPELGGAEYYYEGIRRTIKRKTQLSALLSELCERLFPHTPIINNEVINKNSVTTGVVNNRSKVLTGLLETKLAFNLHLTGGGQDVSIMRSTLINTGVLEIENEDSSALNLEPTDDNLALVLRLIRAFFAEANVQEKNFGELYDYLTRANRGYGTPYNGDTTLPCDGYGLKKGVIPIYIAAVLHDIKKYLVVKSSFGEMKITSDLLNSINEAPQNYTVILENWNDEKNQYIDSLVGLFAPFVIEKEKTYNTFSYVAFAMHRWYLSLPQYAKDLKLVYRGRTTSKRVPAKYVKFLSVLKTPPTNAREYLFETLFQTLGYDEFTVDVVTDVQRAKSIFDSAKNDLLAALILDTTDVFSEQGQVNSSLTSLIKDWCENLKPTTVNHLFSNNEEKVIALMQSVSNDEAQFVEQLGKLIVGLRVEDWKAKNIEEFQSYLVAFKRTVLEFNRNVAIETQSAAAGYKLTFISPEGEIEKTFEKAEHTSRAKLLMNTILSEMEDMGQSISEAEKRQVLMDILEQMC